MEVGTWAAVCEAVKNALISADDNYRVGVRDQLEEFRTKYHGSWRHMYVNGAGKGLQELLDAVILGVENSVPNLELDDMPAVVPDEPRYPNLHVQFRHGTPDGNAFAIIARVKATVQRAGHKADADAFALAALHAHSFKEVLDLTRALVTVDDDDGDEDDILEMLRLVEEDR